MRPERPRIHLTICGQERHVQLHEFATRHAFRPKEMRVPECGAVPQMFKAQQEAPDPADSYPQFLNRVGDMRLGPRRHEREVDIAAWHEPNFIAFERAREFSKLLRKFGRNLKADKDARRPSVVH